MRLVIAGIGILAVAAIAWLVVEARALRAPAPLDEPPPVAARPPPPAAAPPLPSSPPSPPKALARPPRPPRTLTRVPEPAGSPPEPAQPPPPSGPVSPAEVAAARARVEALLAAVTRICPLPRGADRSQHLVLRVTTSRDRVQSLEHGAGALPDAVVSCIDKRLHAARWPATPAPLTLELDVRAADLP